MHGDVLRTERLVLEPLSMAHSAGMFDLWSDPEVCRYSGPIHDYGQSDPSPVRGAEDSDRIIDFWMRACSDGWGLRWAVCEAADGTFVGTVGFNSLGVCAEYAYHLLPRCWHLGLMSEASQAVFGWVREIGCVEIEAFIELANTGSVRFAERNGFVSSDESAGGAMRFVKRVTPH